MDKMPTCLLIANSSKAKMYWFYKEKFFKDPSHQNLHLIGCYVHEESRLKKQELVSDKQGSFGRVSFAETTSPKTHEIEHFVFELIQHIKDGQKAETFHDVMIFAPAHLIGMLEKHMHPELKKLVSKTVEKDFTQLSDAELVKHLVDYL